MFKLVKPMQVDEYYFHFVIVIVNKQAFGFELYQFEDELDLIVWVLIENEVELDLMFDHLDLNMGEVDFDELLMLLIFWFFHWHPNFHHELKINRRIILNKQLKRNWFYQYDQGPAFHLQVINEFQLYILMELE
jgi:hypothetical protein